MVKTKQIAGGVEYAGVADRLKEFRNENPRASIQTSHVKNEDGSVVFSTYILKDKSDEFSADATGTASYNAIEMKKAKAFEKLETISVGRALALLGYLNNGEVATSEEMEDFHAFQEEKLEEAIAELGKAKDIEALKATFKALGKLGTHGRVFAAKEARKAELSEVKNEG